MSDTIQITGLAKTCNLAPQNAPKCLTSADHLISTCSILNEKQKAAVELMLLGKSMTAIAKEVEIDRGTLYRWRQDEDFQEALEQRRRELWSVAADRLAGLVHPSLDVLEQHLEDRYDRARFRAATTVLRLAKLRAM